MSDQAESDARDEDLRQARADAADEDFNARRQMGVTYWWDTDADQEMTVGLNCCPHRVPYGSDCEQCDDDENERRASEDFDLTNNETEGE